MKVKMALKREQIVPGFRRQKQILDARTGGEKSVMSYQKKVCYGLRFVFIFKNPLKQIHNGKVITF